jgi:hypothetical protein
MKNFLKSPLSNALALLLFAVLVAEGLLGGGAPAQLAPLSLAGGTSNITGNLVVSGTGTFTGGIAASSINDQSRAVSISLVSFIECTTDAGATLLDFTSGADSHPDFANSATDGLGFTLSFDATGGSVDTDHVCSQLMVPPDYASGGAFLLRATKSAETGANGEYANVGGSIDGAALGATLPTSSVGISGTASALYTITPALAGLTAGDSLAFTVWITSGGTVDDAVNLAGIAFQYVAVQ